MPASAAPADIYRQLFAKTPNAVALRDGQARIVAVNPAFEQLFRVDAAEAVGRHLAEVVAPAGNGRDTAAEWSDTPPPDTPRARRRRGDGSMVDVALSVLPLCGSEHKGQYFVVYRDIGERIQAEEQIRAAEKKYRSIFENAVEGIFQTTPAGTYLDVNPALADIYGFSSPDQLKEHFKDIKNQLYVNPARRDDFVRLMDRNDAVWGFESEIRRKDGTIIWISENARAVFDEAGEIAYYEGTVVDITERKLSEEALARERAFFTQLFENSPQAIVIIDENRNVRSANQGFEKLFGHRPQDIVGFGLRSFLVPDDLLTECENCRLAALSGRAVLRETARRHKDGRLIPVSMIVFPVKIGAEVKGVIYIYQDISERKAFEDQITHQAFHDALTELPNRALFAERLKRALERAKRRDSIWYAVLMIDLDKFKAVNDSLGHQAGDQLLIEIGRRLSACVRSMDTVARLGGDEFAVILEELKSKKEVLRVVDRVQAALSRPFSVRGSEITPGASIGIVLRPRDYHSAEDILRDADIAMYRAKEQGKGFLLFDRKMHQDILDSINLEAELREAIADGQLILHYQPIVCVQTGRLEGFEALVRWNHPVRGIVPPNRFIPMAEETGLILPLGAWVVRQACRQLRDWQRDMPEEAGELSMSVNVSCRQFTRDGLVEMVSRTLAETGISAKNLKLEITESVLMHDANQTVRELKRLKALGVQIAIDDFGTGYSSLSYLRQLPIDHLKIDRSFISGDDNPEDNIQIVKSIITLARSLGLTVIAEGVEREEQLDRLRGVRCDKAQGYMFSRPVCGETAAGIIRKLSQ